jgi:hypothetical protein
MSGCPSAFRQLAPYLLHSEDPSPVQRYADPVCDNHPQREGWGNILIASAPRAPQSVAAPANTPCACRVHILEFSTHYVIVYGFHNGLRCAGTHIISLDKRLNSSGGLDVPALDGLQSLSFVKRSRPGSFEENLALPDQGFSLVVPKFLLAV